MTLHVFPNEQGGWAVQLEGTDEPISVHQTEWLAEKSALERAYAVGGRVVVSSAATHASISLRAIE
jgi:hypothetical protein